MPHFIFDLKGETVQMDKKDLTLSDCCAVALLSVFQDEQAQPMQTKILRYKLAQKFVQSTDGVIPSLSAEETAEVKLCVSKYWSPLVVGRVFEIIDPKSME